MPNCIRAWHCDIYFIFTFWMFDKTEQFRRRQILHRHMKTDLDISSDIISILIYCFVSVRQCPQVRGQPHWWRQEETARIWSGTNGQEKRNFRKNLNSSIKHLYNQIYSRMIISSIGTSSFTSLESIYNISLSGKKDNAVWKIPNETGCGNM